MESVQSRRIVLFRYIAQIAKDHAAIFFQPCVRLEAMRLRSLLSGSGDANLHAHGCPVTGQKNPSSQRLRKAACS